MERLIIHANNNNNNNNNNIINTSLDNSIQNGRIDDSSDSKKGLELIIKEEPISYDVCTTTDGGTTAVSSGSPTRINTPSTTTLDDPNITSNTDLLSTSDENSEPPVTIDPKTYCKLGHFHLLLEDFPKGM